MTAPGLDFRPVTHDNLADFIALFEARSGPGTRRHVTQLKLEQPNRRLHMPGAHRRRDFPLPSQDTPPQVLTKP